jgi:hypothetical protein
MIIDRARLAGEDAYLRDGTRIDLASGGTAHRGVSPALDDGMALEVAGVHLLIEAGDLEALFARQGAPLLTLAVQKRMFPDLVRDPHTHRVHSIGGFEDFRRGTLRNVEPLEVDGVPTLVSLGTGSCAWRSPIYRMPPEGVELAAASWDLATSRLAPASSFTYGLRLKVWLTDGSTHTLLLADNATPQDARVAEPLTLQAGEDSVRKVKAYQIDFGANVVHDTALLERESGPPDERSRGRPLLAAVNLLERVESAYEFHSLRELTAASSAWQLLERSADAPPRRLVCSLALPARLGKGESISLNVNSGIFERVEAKLDATRLLRPPIDDKP